MFLLFKDEVIVTSCFKKIFDYPKEFSSFLVIPTHPVVVVPF